MKSIILLSTEDGYEALELPDEVQRSPLKSIIPIDLNDDGEPDLQQLDELTLV